ncbi:hypothetical protein CUJ83_05140 [Methanocella sp. CWC-04]|uniref:Antitoxin component YwqK of the YwqJK toxin-antitoxin module n=1 Tax=Methanooceanicella nereidis TaxID=2052831 RepID=A0AAP2RBP1_9EURY|nr:hypothetical protein [Methanocella sp. CWC-04]MCD1294383.1 hypothetical protein [Methanocella sp. CWC-04]
MENRRTLIKAAYSALFLLLFICVCGQASAYDNLEVHPDINEAAVDYFNDYILKDDPYLKNAVLSERQCYGYAFDPEYRRSYTEAIGSVPEQLIKKTPADWISYGGFSADEPEGPMAFRHFYDPLNSQPWLTDDEQIYIAVAQEIVPSLKNPQITAVDWAFHSLDIKYCNEYSFPEAKKDFKLAMENGEAYNEYYGMAWRGVGETMHLMADMTVPSHVRNDGHLPYINPDLYETKVKAIDVEVNKDYAYSEALNYKCTYQGQNTLNSLMKDTALWTNRNFFSLDTVEQYGTGVYSDGKAAHPSPALTMTPSSDGYFYYKPEGFEFKYGEYKLARDSVLTRYMVIKKPLAVMDYRVVLDQEELLIPTAIRSSASVLDAFLPRFQVIIDDVSEDTENPGYYIMKSHVKHIKTQEWQTAPLIGNGAHVVINGVDYVYKPRSGEYLNTLDVSLKAKPGDTVQVYYDLGGYIVYSDVYTIPGFVATPTIKPTATPTIKPSVTPTPTPAADDWLKYYVEYYSNGQKKREYTYYEKYYEGSYLPSQKIHGTYKLWYESGAIQAMVEYRDGEETGPSLRWFSNGQLQEETYYEDGIENGLRTEYYDTGQVRYTGMFVDGKPDGMHRSYYESGARWSEREYSMGATISYKQWDEDGNLVQSL